MTYGHPVLVDDATTETALTYAEPDGSLQTEQHSVPQRVQQADGSWAGVDENLVQGADGSWAPAMTPRAVTFTGGGDTGSTLATVTTGSGAPVTVSDSGLTVGAPTVAGATATYADVLPGVDLLLTATPEGMSEVLQVNTPQAAQNPALTDLTFAVGGATLADGTGHTATATATDGSTVVTPAPTWWDAGNGGTAAGPGGSDEPIPLSDTVAADHLSVDVATAAATPDVTYPLFVDPDFTNGQNGRTFTDNAYPTVAYWNGAGAKDSYQHVGYIDVANSDDGRSHVTRSYWNIPLPQEPAGTHVSSSTFNVQNLYSESCTASPTTLLWTPTVGSGTTWNNQPGSYGQLDTQTYAHGRSGCPTAYVGYDAKSAVAQQIANHAGQITLMLEGTENDITSWKKFAPDVTLTTTVALPPTAPSIIDNSCHRSPGLITGDVLHAGESRQSWNGHFTLDMQSDGNLVEYKAGVGAVWSSATASAGPNGYAVLQTDGNFVVRNSSGGAVFNTGTAGVHGDGPTSNEYLVLQDDGNLVLYTNDGGPAWNSGTSSYSANPAWTCFGNDTSGRQTITAEATNANPANQFYEFHESLNGSATATYSTSGHPTGPGVPVSWQAPVSDDGTYQFYARACLTARDGVAVCGAYSYLINGVLDTQAPPTPTVSTSTTSGTPVSTDPNAPSGTVGQSTVSVHVAAPAAADAVAGYEWTVQVQATASTGFVASSTALCGTSNAGYIVLCTGNATSSPDLQLTPTDETNQLDIVAFDLAGNTSGAGALTFYSTADPNVETASHIWVTDSQPTTGCTGTIADSNTAGSSATLSGNICWTADNPGGDSSSLITQGSTGGRAATSAAVVDTTKSFTVGAWLKTTVNEPSTVGMTALSQQGGHESAFDLQDSGGRWGICMPSSDSQQYSGLCVRAGTSPFAPGAWTFVVAEWDAANKQLRIYVGTDTGGAGNWKSTASDSPTFPSTGTVWIGSGTAGTTEQPFNGEISDPFIAPGLVSLKQMSYFAQGGYTPPTNNNVHPGGESR